VVNARQDIRAIVDVAQDGPNFSTPFVVLDNSGIKTVADLKGKVLAINARGSGVDMGARSVLIKNGLKPGADVSIVEARFPAMEAMLRQGKTHVVVMPAPFLARAMRKGGIRILFRQRDGIGNAQFLFHAAKTDFIRKNRAVMVDLMEDYVRGTHWFLDPANRDAALDIVARITKRPKKAFTSWVFRKGKDLDHSKNGYLDTKALQRNVDVLHEFGILKKSFDVTKFVDHTLLDDANARIK
jgi:ABC-type nitrate/sulfonate/bicarbonate transport system substrate-binding protein